VITDKNKHPAATARWIDYFYGDEGTKMFFMGIEGESYEETSEGVEYVEDIQDNPDGLTKEQALQPYITWLGGGYPAIVKEEYFKGGESSPEALKATEQFQEDIIEETWSKFPYTVEESKELSTLKADIEEYVTEMRDKFIAGQESFDT